MEASTPAFEHSTLFHGTYFGGSWKWWNFHGGCEGFHVHLLLPKRQKVWNHPLAQTSIDLRPFSPQQRKEELEGLSDASLNENSNSNNKINNTNNNHAKHSGTLFKGLDINQRNGDTM